MQNNMTYQYVPKGVCSRLTEFEVDEGIIQTVTFTGGCAGNLQGIGRLVKGRPVQDVIASLQGIRCGSKATSCPDQLALALTERNPKRHSRPISVGQSQ
jgi:uncharacterized protein (TIGR03905 family)